MIGGQAVLLYGEPRLTQDVEVTLGAGTERLPEVLEVVESMGCSVLVKNPGGFVQKTLVLPVQDNETGIRIDFIFAFSPFEMQALKRARKIVIGKTHVCFASPEDLIIHNIIAGRPRDWEDVKGVLVKNANMDRKYILGPFGLFSAIFWQDMLMALREAFLFGSGLSGLCWLKDFETALQKPLVQQFELLWKETR